MIQVSQLKKTYGPQMLFEDVSFNINPGEKLGLVGRNGSGKTTLLKIIQGIETSDSGEFSIPKGYKIGALAQHLSFSKSTILEECVQHLPADEQYDHYKVEALLEGLGFSREDFEKPPESFSGGYQIRLSLVNAILKRPNMLLLDEPTNYLDIIGLRWLKVFIQKFRGEVILITHDKSFMDSVATHIAGISRGQLLKVKGKTVKYYEKLLLDDELYNKTKSNQDRKRKELQSFVDRFKAKASKATQAQSKLKQLDKLENYDNLTFERNLSFSFNYKDCPGKKLLSVDGLSFSYPELEIVKNFGLTIHREDRVAIIGKNGKGKSTLLNLFASELKPSAGKFSGHPLLSIGHLGQTNIDRLWPANTIIEEITSMNSKLTFQQVRAICGAMMFDGDLAEKKVEVLSGGEKSRVLLGKILAKECNLLLLDEPTNHLDQESVESLIAEIDIFQGAILFVTHSEYMLHRLADKLIVFDGGKVTFFDGDYQTFLDKVGWQDEDGFTAPKVKKSKKDVKRLKAEIIVLRSKECKPLQKKSDKLEEEILSLEGKVEEYNLELIEKSQNSRSNEFVELSKKLAKLEKDLEANYATFEFVTNELTLSSEKYQKLLDEIE
jgi:ATP-binding cassette subfamily F protein 3